MTCRGRFHFVYILKLLRNGLVLCLLPMIRALLRFDLQSLTTALKQDAVILAVMALVALLLWHRGGWQLEPDRLVLKFGLIGWHQWVLPFDQVAVLEQSRPIWLRTLGAARVTLYTTRSRPFKKARFYLSRSQGALLSETILPVQNDAVVFAPSGAERLRFVMLSANLAASLALLFVSAQQTKSLLGQSGSALFNQLTLGNLARVEKLVELVLPAGLAWLFTLICMLWGLALLFSFLSTSNFRVSRSGGVILAWGGRVNHTERRVLVSSINFCDVRQSPIARLLRRFPVYLSAGSFTGADQPFLIYKKGEEQLLNALLPAFRLEALDPGPISDRSWPLYLWKGGSAFGVSAVLLSVSLWRMPSLSPLLLIPLGLSAGLLALGIEARFSEGAARQEGGSLRVCYTRHFTRHDLCVLTPDLSFTTFQTPFSETVARCNLYIRLPFRQKLRVRGLKQFQADRLKLTH